MPGRTGFPEGAAAAGLGADLLRRRGFYYQLYNSQFFEAMAEAS